MNVVEIITLIVEIAGLYVTILQSSENRKRVFSTSVALIVIWVFYKPILKVIADTSIIYLFIALFALMGIIALGAKCFRNREEICNLFLPHDYRYANPLPQRDFVIASVALFIPLFMGLLHFSEINIEEYVSMINQSRLNIDRVQIILQNARVSIYCIGKLLGLVILLVNTLKHLRIAIILLNDDLDVLNLPWIPWREVCMLFVPLALCSDFFILFYDKICSVV